jgi:hypothetical protein
MSVHFFQVLGTGGNSIVQQKCESNLKAGVPYSGRYDKQSMFLTLTKTRDYATHVNSTITFMLSFYKT